MTATDQNPQQSAQPTPRKTINVVGAAIVKDGKVLCEVEVANEVCTSSYDYDFGTVVLTSFVCHLISGAPHLTEHHEIRWVAPAEMPTLDWAPADREAVRLISAMDFPAFPAATHESDD